MKRSVLLLLAFAYLSLLQIKAQSTLLGMTSQGGDDFGVIFDLPVGGSSYNNQYNFKNISGSAPYYTKLCQAVNGKLYGMTSGGGGSAVTANRGILFEYDPITNIYAKKIDFGSLANGSTPYGSLISAINGKLYGMTYAGGTYDKGVLFEYDSLLLY